MLQALTIHPDIDECVEATQDALSDVGKTLQHLATQAGVVTGILDTITRAMSRVADNRTSNMVMIETDAEHSFVDYQTRMVAAAKELARIAQEMVSWASFCCRFFNTVLLIFLSALSIHCNVSNVSFPIQ
jgi:talin